MSSFIKHESCEDCGSSDAKGVFDDGHTYCWSCGSYHNSEDLSIERMEKILSPEQENQKELNFPLDFSSVIPSEPYGWLKKYDITDEEIKQNNLGWSKEKEMLIFPYYEKDNNDRETNGQDKKGQTETTLIFWQGRFFPQRKPKTISHGNINDNIIIINSDIDSGANSVGSICVVEDPVSAIKVSRAIHTLPLFGSHLSLEKAIRISKFYDTLILWLDNDKSKQMIQFSQKFRYLFKEIKIISTEKDPKENGFTEIKNLLF